jgi:hypothetical protein
MEIRKQEAQRKAAEKGGTTAGHRKTAKNRGAKSGIISKVAKGEHFLEAKGEHFLEAKGEHFLELRELGTSLI